ncbi:cobalamin biosynthesis protein CobW [Iodidimonas sp. SYSU 1G8]|uniref:cobalamin biosynthesis protein CobW n=1 Tax=Iodidimonas sp. SYSU 1G8 TaxID=3133967 RepID=UPI0031FF1C57
MTAKIPATVITGFLGAGKTTLIRNLLRNAGGRRLALIVNEFGDVGIDGDLLKGCGEETCRDEDIVELANGCICCTVADDFLPTIQMLLDRAAPPDHIIIETSGLALPKPLVRAFNWPEIRTRVTVDGVVTVVDAAAVSEGRFADDEDALAAQRAADGALDHDNPLEELFEDQLACADLVLLNKTDLLQHAPLEDTRALLRTMLPPSVKLLSVVQGKLDADVLLGLKAGAEDDLDSRPSHHDADGDHDHDDFDSFVLEGGTVADPARLIAAMQTVIETHDILRLKGFAAVAGRDMRMVIQAVGSRIQHHYDRSWDPREMRTTRLVVIGETGLERDVISAALLAAMT